jgi:hypothetical protein
LNANLDAIEAALENTLSRDGTSPNQMSAPLDMNSNRVTNLAAPVSGSDAARLTDVMAGSGSFTAAGTGAVERTFQDKLRDHLHVLDFIPAAEHAAILSRTSTFDCSADVAECITAASAQKKSVKFGGGRYRFLSDLAIPVGNGSAIDISGEGKELTQIEFFGAGSTRGIVLDGVTGYVYAGSISDLTVFPNTGAGRAITLENLNKPKVENVNILNAPAVGIYIDTCIMPRLSHLLLNGCGSASFGAIEIDNSTTAFLDEVYISGGEAAGGTGKIGGILIDRSVNFTMLGGAIESTGTPIKIASKSEGTIACDGGVVIGTDLENPGNNLPFIDAGAGWTGAAALAATSWTFMNAHGFPSGTTTSLYGVKLEDTTGFTFTNCSLNQAGTPTSLYELVGTGNKGTVINPCRALYGGAWPYVRVNGVHQTDATPIVTWNPESPALIDVSKTLTGSTPSASVFAAQGGVYSKFYMNNGGATNLTNLTDAMVGAVVTLIDGVGNTTIKHQAGGSGQFDNPGNTDVVMVQNQPYLYYNNPATGRWSAYASNRLTTIELGHASDTTLARSSAGNMTIEGNLVYRAGGTDVPITDGGTGSSTADGARTALAVVGTADLAASTGAALVGFLQSGTSATSRTVQAKLRDVINVKDFGATGDGTTDDTAFLQAAATAAGALKADLVIPATGTFYKLTTELTIPANVRVYGGGHLKQTVVDKNAVIMSNDTSIENIKIEGPALLSVAAIKNTGIQITGVSRVQVRNCDISGFETGGILLRNCFDVLIDGNYLHENDWQGSSPGASGGDIYSFSSTSSGRIIITNNFCMSNSSQGIGVADNGLEQDVIVANNVCITLDASGAVRSSGTLVRRHAILLGYTSQTFPERRVVCADNLVGNTQWTGIYAQVNGAENTPPIDISGNMIFDVGYDTTNALSGAVYVAARGTLPITVRNNTSLRCRNTLDNCGAFVAVSGGTGTTGVVVFENNVALDSSGNGMFIGALINDVSIKGHVSRNSTKKDVYYLSNPTHAPSKDFVWEGLDIVRNNTSDVAVSVTPDSGVTKRVKIKNFHIVGFDGTVNVTTNNALSIRYPLLTDVYDGEIDNFYRATNELSYAVATTRYFNTVIRDRIIVRNCVNGFGFGGTATSSTWVAQDCIFINVTNKFHGSTISGFIAGKEGRRNGDKLELYGFTAAPTTGTAAVGDRAPNQTPVVGQPKAWSVTVAGSPGTWVSEGNL